MINCNIFRNYAYVCGIRWMRYARTEPQVLKFSTILSIGQNAQK